MATHSTEGIHIHIKDEPKLVKEGVFLVDSEVWNTQKRIAKIYGKSVPTINDHLKKIYKEKELSKVNTERVLFITQKEGKKEVTRKVLVYNTDVLIAVGFRVQGEWGKEFRVWAREIVRDNYNPVEQVKLLIKSR